MAEHRFHTPAPVDLDVDIPVGEIHVETIDGDESYVSVTGNEKLVEQTEVRLDGNRLVDRAQGQEAVRHHHLDRRVQLRQRRLERLRMVPHPRALRR